LTEISTADLERFIGRYSLGRDSNPLNPTESLHFLRIKVPGGFITSEQFRHVADLAKTYGREYTEITDRQDIQLHWIRSDDALQIFSVMDKLGFTTDMCGQSFSGARYGDARNIVCCPVSGVEKDELLNGYPLVKKLTDLFIGNPDFMDMPRKFKFSISGCGSDCTRAEINDLAFVAVRKEGEVGFTLLAGGSIGVSLPGPRLAKPLNVFVRPEEAFDVAVATIEIHRDYGNRESKAKARFKWLLDNWGFKKFLNVLEGKLGRTLESYDGSVFLKHSSHEGVQPQSQEGYYYVNIPLMGGRLSSDEMVSLANFADEYGNDELRLTATQNIIIPNVKEKDMLLKRLEETGFSLNGSKLRWTSMGCASDFCGKSTSPHAKEIFREIVSHLEKQFGNELLDEMRFRIHVSGCPNNCCANLIAEIGLAGKLVRKNGEMTQSYDILLGGGFGQNSSLGRIVEMKVPASRLKHKVEFLLRNYLKKRKQGESLREFCNRHTVEELKSYLNSTGE
jgi:sulfite reductase (ferredoxin)